MSKTCPKGVQNMSKICPRRNMSKSCPNHVQNVSRTVQNVQSWMSNVQSYPNFGHFLDRFWTSLDLLSKIIWSVQMKSKTCPKFWTCFGHNVQSQAIMIWTHYGHVLESPSLPLPGTWQREGWTFTEPFEQIENTLFTPQCAHGKLAPTSCPCCMPQPSTPYMLWQECAAVPTCVKCI